MGYFFGDVLMAFWAAQFVYGFIMAGIAISGYGFVVGGGTFLKNLFKGEDVKKSLGTFIMSVMVIVVIGLTWHNYEANFFDCEKALAIDGENSYSCAIRESIDGEWSSNRSVTKGSEPYMKYNRELYK